MPTRRFTKFSPVKKLAFLLILVYCAACTPYAPEDLSGDWTGLSLTEEGDSVPIDPANLRFNFDPAQQTYTFHSTLNYQEQGDFRLERDRLYTTDRSREGALEKVVKITQLENDTLRLKMNSAGKEQIMILRRDP